MLGGWKGKEADAFVSISTIFIGTNKYFLQTHPKYYITISNFHLIHKISKCDHKSFLIVKVEINIPINSTTTLNSAVSTFVIKNFSEYYQKLIILIATSIILNIKYL